MERTGQRDAWTRGGLAPYFPMMRPVLSYRCHSGGVARDEEFEVQAERARAVTAWYSCYVRVLSLANRTVSFNFSREVRHGDAARPDRRCRTRAATCAAALAGEDSVGHGSAAQAVGTPSTCMVGMWVDESAQPRTERLWLHRSVSLRGGTPPVVCIGSGII